MDFDVGFFISLFPRLLWKVPYTLFLGCIAFGIAFALGLLLEICYTSRCKFLQIASSIYISYFRSTPYITQLFIFYFGLPQIFPPMRKLVGGTVLVITIAMNSAAFIAMVKNTAIGFTIGVVDILAQAKIYAASSLNFFEAYIAVGLMYWGILLLLNRILKYWEARICKYL